MKGATTWAELQSQPAAWEALLSRLTSGALTAPLDLGAYDEVLLLGSGTSYYLALAVADWLRRRGHCAQAVASCEVLLDPFLTRPVTRRRLAVGFSRSGRSSELLMANDRLRAAGFTLLGIGCTAGSALMTQVDHAILVVEGHEDGLVMLRSFTSMLLAAQWLWGDATDRAGLSGLPAAGRALLAEADRLTALAQARPYDRFVFLASGPQHPLALESALKIQEMAVATSEAYHSLDYRHGPKACADANTVVVLFALSDRALGQALARDMRALGATLVVLGRDAAACEASLTLAPGDLPSDEVAAAALMIAVQLFAFATAMRRGLDPDAPVNLSKVVEF